jgi:hypothetical protein
VPSADHSLEQEERKADEKPVDMLAAEEEEGPGNATMLDEAADADLDDEASFELTLGFRAVWLSRSHCGLVLTRVNLTKQPGKGSMRLPSMR